MPHICIYVLQLLLSIGEASVPPWMVFVSNPASPTRVDELASISVAHPTPLGDNYPNRVIGNWAAVTSSTCADVELKGRAAPTFFSGHSGTVLGRMSHICIYVLLLLLSIGEASVPPWMVFMSNPASPTRVDELASISVAHPTPLGDNYLNRVIGNWTAVTSSTCADVELKDPAAPTFFSGHSGTVLGSMPHVCIYVLLLLLSIREASVPLWMVFLSNPASPKCVDELASISVAHPAPLGDNYLNRVIGNWTAITSSTCADVELKDPAAPAFFSGHSGTGLGRMPHV